MRHSKRSVGNFQIIAPDVNADDSQRMAMLTELLKIQFKTLNNQNLQRLNMVTHTLTTGLILLVKTSGQHKREEPNDTLLAAATRRP